MDQNSLIKELKRKISLLEKEKEKLKKLVYLDYLTKVYNRRGLLDNGNRYFESLKKVNYWRRKNEIRDLSVIFIDIDDFKKINDKYGHQKGDQVLKSFASFLKENFRKTDIIGRWGGEEFVVLLINVPYFLTKKKAETVRKKIEKSSFSKIKITASLGVVCYKKEKSLIDLLNKADKLMYLAKKTGKNRVVFK